VKKRKQPKKTLSPRKKRPISKGKTFQRAKGGKKMTQAKKTAQHIGSKHAEPAKPQPKPAEKGKDKDTGEPREGEWGHVPPREPPAPDPLKGDKNGK